MTDYDRMLAESPYEVYPCLKCGSREHRTFDCPGEEVTEEDK